MLTYGQALYTAQMAAVICWRRERLDDDSQVERMARSGELMIDGVKIIPLKQIVDERGKIMHMLKATDPHFIKFGEIYFSCAWPGTIKAWHIHKTNDDQQRRDVRARQARHVRSCGMARQPKATSGSVLGRRQLLPRANAARNRERLQGLWRQDGDPGELCDRAARPERDRSDRSVYVLTFHTIGL